MNPKFLNYYPTPLSEVAWQKIDDTSLLVQLETGHSCVLDSTGTEMWELMNGNRTIKQIAKELEKRYNATLEKLTTEVDKFSQSLEEQQFVRLSQKPVKLPQTKIYAIKTK